MNKASVKRQRLRTIVLATILCTKLVEPTAERPLKHSVAAKFCSFSKAAKQAQNKLSTALTAAKGTIEQNRKAHLQNVLAAINRPDLDIAALILAEFAGTQTGQAIADLAKVGPAETATVGQAVYAAGAIDGFIEVLLGHGSENVGDNKNCIGDDASGNGKEFNMKEQCGSPEIKEAGDKPGDLEAMMTTAFADVGSNPQASGGSDCLIFEDLATEYTTKTRSTKFVGGLISVHTATGLEAAATLEQQKTSNTILKDIAANWKTAAAAMEPTAGRAPTTEQEYKDLLKDESSRQKLQGAAQAVNNWKGTAKPANMDAYLKQVFKIDANGNSAYVTAMKGITMDVPTKDGETQKKDLFDMSEEDLEAAVAAEIRRLSSKTAKLTTEVKQLRHNQGMQATEDTCNKIKDEAECNKTAVCSYSTTETDENKKCKLDAKKATANGAPVTQTQSGGTTTVNCGQHKNPTDCEAENKNVKACDKAVCGWITFTEKEGTLKEPQCRSSSFLLNKKFALSVVSAAFVALLF